MGGIRSLVRIGLYQLEEALAIRSFYTGDGGYRDVPVTNLNGLVSRSPSDIFAIVPCGEGRERW